MRERKEKKIQRHQNSNDDIIGMVGKISMRRIQRHQERSLIVIKIGHTNSPETSEPWYLWKAHMTHSVHGLWFYVVLLDSSHWDLSNVTSNVIIRVLLCLQDLFIFCFLLSSQITRKRKKNMIQTPPQKNHLKFSILSFDWITLLQSTKLAG